MGKHLSYTSCQGAARAGPGREKFWPGRAAFLGPCSSLMHINNTRLSSIFTVIANEKRMQIEIILFLFWAVFNGSAPTPRNPNSPNRRKPHEQ